MGRECRPPPDKVKPYSRTLAPLQARFDLSEHRQQIGHRINHEMCTSRPERRRHTIPNGLPLLGRCAGVFSQRQPSWAARKRQCNAALLWALRGRLSEFRDYTRNHWRLGLLGALASTLAYGTILWAMTQAPIAMVAALRESSVIFAVLISALWFKEGQLKRGLIASIVLIFGVFLLRS